MLVIGAGIRTAWRRLRRLPSSPWIQVEIVAALIVGWNLVIGVLFELGEQYRFRAVTDPITMSIACWLVWRMVTHLHRERTTTPELLAR